MKIKKVQELNEKFHLEDNENVQSIIAMLQTMDVDGETMQYILEEVGMERQMLGQLIRSMPIEDVLYEISNREELDDTSYLGQK